MEKGNTVSDKFLAQEILDLPLTPVPVRFGGEADAYKNQALHFAMNAGMEISAGGRLFSCWIGGEDGPEAFLMSSYSDDGGETWNDIQIVIDPRSDDCPHSFNVHVAGMWRDPMNRMWLFYQQSLGMWDGRGAVFALICDHPDAEKPVWNQPVFVCNGAVIKKPIVLSNGEWLLPVSIWERWHVTAPLENCHRDFDHIRGANVFASGDCGRTWEYRGGIIIEDSCFNEHSIVELSDGRIMMTVRCNGTIKRTFSTDWGRTWREAEVYFPHVTSYSSMAAVRKLQSGHLLLIKHGNSMEEATTGRTHLSAFISADDGASWQGGLLLDERNDVSYPDICQTDDGTIYVQYDRERYGKAEILFARFREEDVAAADFITPNAKGKNIIHDLQGVKGSSFDLFQGAAEGFESGSGTMNDPFVVANARQFIYLAQQVYCGNKFADKYIIQSGDIDFGGDEVFPIGSLWRGFGGCYDGQGHRISNFTMQGKHFRCRGVFGYIEGGVVKNLVVANASIGCKSYVGGVVGLARGTDDRPARVENCRVEKDVELRFYSFGGGIVGVAEGHVNITGCHNCGLIYLPRATNSNRGIAGGIVGLAQPIEKDGPTVVNITNCRNSGDIVARYMLDAAMGGICGEGAVRVTGCTADGNITLKYLLNNCDTQGICGKCHDDSVLEGNTFSGRINRE